MSSTKEDDVGSLLLTAFPLANQRIHLLSHAGSGGAGYVFKVRIGKKTYAAKLFKFDNPDLNVSRLKGLRRRAVCDNFFVECRANGSLIQQGLNGHVTPYCYGWFDVPATVEERVARLFEIPQFLWERPAAKQLHNIKGILFEWIDGKALSQVRMNPDITAQARAKVKALHNAGILHGDLAAPNFLVDDQGEKQQVHLLDLSASVTLPHIHVSAQMLDLRMQEEIEYLEHGFLQLSKQPINKGLCIDDLCLQMSILDDSLIMYTRHRWAPPRPTCWQEAQAASSEHSHLSPITDVPCSPKEELGPRVLNLPGDNTCDLQGPCHSASSPACDKTLQPRSQQQQADV